MADVVWRAMDSLLVLLEQANEIAPSRSHASDGLVGDEDHQGTNSDHNPHFVPGVGADIVTALDLTHDPAHGFDSFKFAETLRRNRDKRIKYVISNRRIFSSYVVGSTPAWTWRTYSGSDPHTNHVHISVLDSAISDTRTPWNLEGFDMSVADVTTGVKDALTAAAARGPLPGQEETDPTGKYGRAVNNAQNEIAARQLKPIVDALIALDGKVQQILDKLNEGTSGGTVAEHTHSVNVSGSTSGVVTE